MKIRIFSFILSLLGLNSVSAASPSDYKPSNHVGLSEASSNFELSDMEPFFNTLKPLFDDGFGPTQVLEIKNFAEKIPVEQEAEKMFQVKFEGEKTQIFVKIFMDDIDAPDVYVFAPKKLADSVQKKMTEYSEKLGR
jgi:hypothetical protein